MKALNTCGVALFCVPCLTLCLLACGDTAPGSQQKIADAQVGVDAAPDLSPEPADVVLPEDTAPDVPEDIAADTVADVPEDIEETGDVGEEEPLVDVIEEEPPEPFSDLAISEVLVPMELHIGDPLDIEIHLANLGTRDLSNIQGEIFISEDDILDDDDYGPIATLRSAELGVGMESVVTVNVPILPFEVSEGVRHVCVSALPVGGDSNRPNNRVCSAPVNIIRGCLDRFEVNDAPEQAAELTRETTEGLTLCEEDRVDHYRFCMPAFNDLDVILSDDLGEDEGGARMRLWRTVSGERVEPVMTQVTVQGQDALRLGGVPYASCYELEVSAREETPLPLEYSLRLAQLEILCRPGYPEPNETPEQARDGWEYIEAQNDIRAMASLCPSGDEDYFVFDLDDPPRAFPVGEEFTFTVRSFTDDIEFSAALLSEDLEVVSSSTDLSAATLVTEGGGIRYLHVSQRPMRGDYTMPYSIHVH